MTATAGTDRSRRATPAVAPTVLLTAALLVLINVLGLPLRTGAAPAGIVSLQLATGPEAAAAILDSWSAVPRARLLWAHGLDVLLPVAYALAIRAVAARTAATIGAAHAAPRIAGSAALLAAVADQVENVAMGITILAVPTTAGVTVTLVAAVVKWGALALALVAASLALLAARRGGRRR